MSLQQRADGTSVFADGDRSESARLNEIEANSPAARAAVAHQRLVALLQDLDEVHGESPDGVITDDPADDYDAENDVATLDAPPQVDSGHIETDDLVNSPAEIEDHATDAGIPETTPSGESQLSEAELASLSDEIEAEDENSEQRFASRRKTKMKAIILVTGSSQQTHCTVADISSTGALLQLPIEMHTVSRAGDHVPARFTLFMPTQRTEIDCELAWRSGNKIGARFVSPLRQIKAEKRQKPQQPAQSNASAGGIVSKLFSR